MSIAIILEIYAYRNNHGAFVRISPQTFNQGNNNRGTYGTPGNHHPVTSAPLLS
jgi:hypothetical protein